MVLTPKLSGQIFHHSANAFLNSIRFFGIYLKLRYVLIDILVFRMFIIFWPVLEAYTAERQFGFWFIYTLVTLVFIEFKTHQIIFERISINGQVYLSKPASPFFQLNCVVVQVYIAQEPIKSIMRYARKKYMSPSSVLNRTNNLYNSISLWDSSLNLYRGSALFLLRLLEEINRRITESSKQIPECEWGLG